MYSVSLNATKEIVPADRRKPEDKVFKLTVVFDYKESEEEYPVGNTSFYKTVGDVSNVELFKDGVQIPYEHLLTMMVGGVSEIDLDEEIDLLQQQAIAEYRS